jgi:diguanylate cyclase (GGDEF)-like protein
MAIKDVLSGQYNRRYFLGIGARIMQRCKRYGRPISLAIVDIDHFKRVNDRFGHDAGDVVIRETARCMRQRIRETDLLARWGGEEFVILLPESDQETSSLVAERVRQDIEAMSIVVGGLSDPLTITASLGVAKAKPELDSLMTLIKKADQALYRAKEAGRNRVVLQDEGLGSTNKTL